MNLRDFKIGSRLMIGFGSLLLILVAHVLPAHVPTARNKSSPRTGLAACAVGGTGSAGRGSGRGEGGRLRVAGWATRGRGGASARFTLLARAGAGLRGGRRCCVARASGSARSASPG